MTTKLALLSSPLLALMLALGMCIGAASAGRPVSRRYSGYHCYNTNPSSSSPSPETRTCKFTNICFSEGGEWLYHAKGGSAGLSSKDRAFLGGKSVVAYGPLARHVMAFRVVDGPAGAPNQSGHATVLNCAQSTSYSRWLLDDLFGLHWMLRFHDKKAPSATPALFDPKTGLPNAPKIDLVNMCRVTRYSETFNTLFTDHGQFSLECKNKYIFIYITQSHSSNHNKQNSQTKKKCVLLFNCLFFPIFKCFFW